MVRNGISVLLEPDHLAVAGAARLRDARGEDLTDSRFGTRLSGEGEVAAMIARLFARMRARLRLDRPPGDSLDPGRFRPAGERQGELF